LKPGDLVKVNRDEIRGELGIVVVGGANSARVKLNNENFSRWVSVEYLEIISEINLKKT